MSKREVIVVDFRATDERVAERVRARRDLHYLADVLAAPNQSPDELATALRLLHPRAAALLWPTEVVALATLAVRRSPPRA